MQMWVCVGGAPPPDRKSSCGMWADQDGLTELCCANSVTWPVTVTVALGC